MSPDTMPDGCQFWLDWHLTLCPDNRAEIEALKADCGRNLGYVRLVGRRSAGVKLEDPVVSAPAQYTKKPLLRADEE